MTAITYDQGNFETISTLSADTNLKDKVYITVDVAPLKESLLIDNIAYDYFFLYIESMAGERRLDLIVTEIDLSTEATKTKVFDKLDLLGNQLMNDNAYQYIMNNYSNLYKKIQENNNMTDL